MTGSLDLHGERFFQTWTRLAKTATPGDDFLLLQHAVNWEPGQELVLVTTAVKDSREWHQNEQLTVKSVVANPMNEVGSVVYLTSKVQHVHLANDAYQGEVGLLTRTIKIQGAEDSIPADPDPLNCKGNGKAHQGDSRYGDRSRPCAKTQLTGYGGHVMIHHMGVGFVEGVELFRMGQTNVLGRYPMHFHLLEKRCPGCYFRDSSVHESYYRCISIHGTHNIFVSENVAFDVTGFCYYLEDGVEEDNTISFNLAAHVHPIGAVAQGGTGQTLPLAYASDTLTIPADVAASGFYITNLHNKIVGNAASGGWSGYSLPVLHRALGPHKDLNFRPSNRVVLEFDGNTAHSTGWWWKHTGAIYSGGALFYQGNKLVYNAGRAFDIMRVPCTVDPCTKGPNFDCNQFKCPQLERAWNRITNTKVFLVPGTGISSWNGGMEVVKYDAHDVGLGLASLSPTGFWIDQMNVECRTGEKWAMPPDAEPKQVHASGFFWYDTLQEHIVTNSVFRNCGWRSGYSLYEPSSDRGCNGNMHNGCHEDSTTFGFVTHSDLHTPELMQGTKNLKFDNCGRRFQLKDYKANNNPSTVSGRGQNWLDMDGSASGLDEPTIIGSGLLAAGLWWTVDDDVVHDPQGPLKFIKKNSGPERGLGHIRFHWDSTVHSQVGKAQCGNGNGNPCPAYGYIRHWGPKFDGPNNFWMPVTANPEIVGPTGGFGWFLKLNGGSPKNLKIDTAEISVSTPLMLATAYPRGTTFNVYAQAGSGCNYLNKNRYSCKETFTKVNSVSQVRFSTGNVYHFDSSSGLLYVRIVQMPDDFVGDKSWHRWDYNTPSAWETGAYALERFSRGGVTLPTGKPGKSYVMIEATCSSNWNSKYCSQKALSWAKPSVCSAGYQQVAYDKCCKGTGPARQCEFANGANVNKLASTEEDGGESGGGGGGMGGGPLMGIVVGAIAVAGLVGAIAYRMWSRRRSPIDDVSVGSQGLTVSRVDACLSDVDTCLSAARTESSEQPIKHSSDTIDPDGMELTRTHSLPDKFFECDSTLAINAADDKPAPSA